MIENKSGSIPKSEEKRKNRAENCPNCGSKGEYPDIGHPRELSCTNVDCRVSEFIARDDQWQYSPKVMGDFDG